MIAFIGTHSCLVCIPFKKTIPVSLSDDFAIVTKLSISILIVTTVQVRTSKLLKAIVGYIGKWSMADVFVAASFLSFLSFYNMNPGINTETNTLMGLYYFFAYVLLSIASTQFIEIAVKREEKAVEII